MELLEEKKKRMTAVSYRKMFQAKKKRTTAVSYRKMFQTKKQCLVCCDTLMCSHGVSWVRLFLLGKGGFGSVFYAKRRISIMTEDSHLPFDMAVKSAKIDHSSWLQYEKKIFSKLGSYPYVVRCYGDEITQTGIGEMVYNLLLEFCSGQSLGHQIKLSGNGLSESDVRNYTQDILYGLSYIHGKGFVHCDIKPDNILLVPARGKRSVGFIAKIADFGLAKEVVNEQKGCAGIRGTYMYLAPELVKEKRLEYSADIWALGCVVLEMLTAKPPWECSDKAAVLFQLGHTQKLPIIPNHLSEMAKGFLSWCFERNCDWRLSADMLLNHPFVCIDDG